MARNATARLLNVTCDTPSRDVAHGPATSSRDSPRRRNEAEETASSAPGPSPATTHLTTALAADAATPLAVLGGLILWLLRLALAPASTLAGFRAWVLEECPVAPGRRAPRPPPAPPPRPGRPHRGGRGPAEGDQDRPVPFFGHRTARALASVPLDASPDRRRPGPPGRLNPGAARTALRNAVLSARNGDPR